MRLELDMSLVDQARSAAESIADSIQPIIDAYTTTSIENSPQAALGRRRR